MKESPATIVLRLADRLGPVDSEHLPLAQCVGRVLAADVLADRDSPACDVSAMDGYSVRTADLAAGRLPVRGEVRIGRPPPPQPPGAALRIVTGAPLPPGADAVVRREDVEEHPDFISLRPGMAIEQGLDVRRRGENLRAGERALTAGTLVTPAVASALAAFGIARPAVRRRVNIAVIVSGDEVLDVEAQPAPWQLRDGNSAALRALLDGCAWVRTTVAARVGDDLDAIARAMREATANADAVLLSGGVSVGERDFVPAAARAVGAEVVFHGLPIRPGKPLLGAAAPGGKPIIGLPGNPVSVLVTACRFASMVLRRLAGFAGIDPPATLAEVDDPHMSNPRLWLYRPVQLAGDRAARIMNTRGSGDFVSAARSDGFVEIPAGAPPDPMRCFYRWSM